MLVLNALLVLPAVTVLAMPGVTVTKVQDLIARVGAAAIPASSSELVLPHAPALKEREEGTIPCHSSHRGVCPPSEDLNPITDINSSLDKRVKEPDLPEFIDTGACICGLLRSQSTLGDNGEIVEMWRCTADAAHSIISQGGNGKWYNTSLPSQEISGVNGGMNWGGNPPTVTNTYVLTFHDGGASYELLNAGDSGSLHGDDYKCTGVNDTSASTTFYAGQHA